MAARAYQDARLVEMRLPAAFLDYPENSGNPLPLSVRGVPTCFLTWRLAGSLPVRRIAESWTTEGAGFLAFDKVLDARATGPRWLTRPGIARAVIGTLYAGQQKGFYELGSWVVMPNHVHALIRPLCDLSRIVSGIRRKESFIEQNRRVPEPGLFRPLRTKFGRRAAHYELHREQSSQSGTVPRCERVGVFERVGSYRTRLVAASPCTDHFGVPPLMSQTLRRRMLAGMKFAFLITSLFLALVSRSCRRSR